MPQITTNDPISSDRGTRLNNYNHFSVQPICGALGAEISDIDLTNIEEESCLREIHDALMEYQVIAFRDQRLAPQQLVDIGRHFGDLNINPFVEGLEEAPEVMPIRSEENHEKQFTGLWHSDLSWHKNPSLGSLLYAVDVPVSGGDTLFANMYLALSTLSSGLQEMLRGLDAVHCLDRFNADLPRHEDLAPDGAIHPVVRIHPVTRKEILFVNEYFTTRFDNMTESESAPLLKYLFENSVRPDFTCRIKWQPGTLVFWDNRCTLHYATNDYPGQRRLMHRITINGDSPGRLL